MRRQKINLDAIADRENLLVAAHRAGRSKRHRPEVIRIFDSLEQTVAQLSDRILQCAVPIDPYHTFQIHDPKPRIIHAPGFKDRVIHHAIINHIGQTLDRALVDSSFACRKGKGALAAVHSVQSKLRRYPWYVQIDVDGYFDHIDHITLKRLLRQRFKGHDGLQLLDTIIDSYRPALRRGLPIGTLTSQHFANCYLDGADRFILEQEGACAHVRYMDDIVWWSSTKEEALEQLESVRDYLTLHRQLSVKSSVRVQRSVQGIRFCGYRVLPFSLRLTPRRKRRFRDRRQYWEDAWSEHAISDNELQQYYAGIHSTVCQADSFAWRVRQLERYGEPDA